MRLLNTMINSSLSEQSTIEVDVPRRPRCHDTALGGRYEVHESTTPEYFPVLLTRMSQVSMSHGLCIIAKITSARIGTRSRTGP